MPPYRECNQQDREARSKSPQDDHECLDCHAVCRSLTRENTEEDGWSPGQSRYMGYYASDLWSNVKSRRMQLIENALLWKSARITAMVPLKLLPNQKRTLLGRLSLWRMS